MEALTVAKAAQVSGLSAATIKRKIASGELRAKANKQGWNTIEHSDLMTFLATASLGKTREGASAHKSLRAKKDSEPAQLMAYLERELSDTKIKNRELEAELKIALSEIRKLEAEMRAHLSGKGIAQTLSRWIRLSER